MLHSIVTAVSLRRVVAVAIILVGSPALAAGGSASGSRLVHQDPDGQLWIEYQTLLKQYVDPHNARWIDHDHVDIYGCPNCSSVRPSS